MSINRILNQIKEKRISRRAFLKGAGATAGSLLLAGCGPADPEKLAALAGAGAAALDKNRRENGADGNSEDAKSADDDAKSKDCDSKSEDHDSHSKDDDSRSRDDDSRSEDNGCNTALAPTITKTTYDGANVLVEWTPASAGDHTFLISGSDGSAYTPPGPVSITGTAPFATQTMPVPATLDANVTYGARVCNGTACAPDFPVNSKTATLLHLAYDNTTGQEYVVGAWQQIPTGYQAGFRITDPNGTAGVIPDSPLIASPGTTEAAMGSLAAVKSYDGLMVLKKDGAEAYSLSERTAFTPARLANPTVIPYSTNNDGSFTITNTWEAAVDGVNYTYFFAVMTMTGGDLSDLVPTMPGNVNTSPYTPYSLYFSIKAPNGSIVIPNARTFNGALGLNYSGNSNSNEILKGIQPLDSVPILTDAPDTGNAGDFGEVAFFSSPVILQNVINNNVNLIMTYAGRYPADFAYVDNAGAKDILSELGLYVYFRQ